MDGNPTDRGGDREADKRISLPGGRRNLAKSATRALDILEYFAMSRRPLRAAEIANAFGWHSSSTDQLLKTMVDSGHLMFDGALKLYRPSPRLVRFATWLSDEFFGGRKLHRLLDLVHSRSGEIVTLAVRQEAHMQVVDVVQPANSRYQAARGVKVPLVGSALGAAYLAACADADVARLLSRLSRRGALKGQDTTQIPEMIRTVRTRGYASGGIGADRGDSWSIAVALPPCAADTILVLGFAGPAERIESREQVLAALLNRCVNEVLMS